MTNIPMLELAGGVAIPQLGFGVFQVPPEDTAAVVGRALEQGYRHIDTAAAYGNEEGVGQAIAAAGIARERLFVTTKLRNADQGYDATLRAFDGSARKLGLDVVDLYLIHWPAPAHDRYVASWTALQRLLADGRVRAIGVSNFQPAHLLRLLDQTGVAPAINQIELHPRFQQPLLRRFHAEHGIATEAWAPLAKGAAAAEPAIAPIAAAHGRTAAQVVLRWHLQLGNVVIPKSVTPARIAENRDLFDFELSTEQMEVLAALDGGPRTGPDPDTHDAL